MSRPIRTSRPVRALHPLRLSRRSRLVALAVGVLVLATVGTFVVRGLSETTYTFAAAPDAGAPACTRISEEFPERLAGLERGATDTVGAAVWGDGAVIARCGFAMPGATTDPCTQVDGVDWVWRSDEDREGRALLITYGREPALEVQVAPDKAATDAVLVGLSGLVQPIEQSRECLDGSYQP
ncbi:DUF3515 family protein [Streptomyces sp. NPDC002643]